jgi:hypothetical protein
MLASKAKKNKNIIQNVFWFQLFITSNKIMIHEDCVFFLTLPSVVKLDI